tara:strand:- start:150 stop:293 length:144 start_codon:yes stop_codon:yes gene_type:complete
MKLVSSKAVSTCSTEEIHTFLCDENFRTKQIEVQVSDLMKQNIEIDI